MSGPLDGVRVLDLTSVILGPYAAQNLADMGADVTKIESLQGDIMRLSGPMRSPKMGHFYLTNNQNKKSISVDLKSPEGHDIFLKMAVDCDVVLYNIRPKAMARLGLSYEDLCKVNPEIIYVGAFGYSERGPYAGRPAYDDLIQGEVGIPHLVQQAGADVPRFAPFVLADRLVGLQTANAVVAALYHKKETGHGQRVDVPMFEGLTSVIAGEHLAGTLFEPAIGPSGYQRSISPNRRPYATKDGHICVMVYSDKQWRIFLDLIGKPEMFENDARFASQNARLDNIDYVYGYLSDILGTRTSKDWIETLLAADIPVTPMNSIKDVRHDVHLNDIGFFEPVEHPTEGPMVRLAIPTEWSQSQPEHRHHAPQLGENTFEILNKLGLSENEIHDLAGKGIIHDPEATDTSQT